MSVWVDRLALAFVVLAVLAAIFAVVILIYLAVWWQPDCHALLEQGKQCRDWPWEAVPK